MSRYAAAGDGPPVEAPAVDLKGTHRPIRVFLMDGHGTDMMNPITRKPVIMTVPKNKYYVTFTECGLLSSMYSPPTQEAFMARSSLWSKVPPKYIGPVGERCKSDYMKFKHELGLVVGFIENQLAMDFNPYSTPPSYRTAGFSLLAREFHTDGFNKNQPLTSYNDRLQEVLCDLYDRKIHIHYPGEEYVDNEFIPTNLTCGAGASEISLSGILDRDLMIALRGDVEPAMKSVRFPIGASPPGDIVPLYMASVWPTMDSVAAQLEKQTGTKTRAVDYRSDAVIKYYMRSARMRVSDFMEGRKEYRNAKGNELAPTWIKKKASEILRERGDIARAAATKSTEPPDGAPELLLNPLCRVCYYMPAETAALRRTESIGRERGEEAPAPVFGPVPAPVFGPEPARVSGVKRRAEDSVDLSGSKEARTGGQRKRKTYRKKRRTRKTTRRTRQ